MAKTRRAPARHASREKTPGPQPISATVSPGRTAVAIALAYAPKRPASAIIAPKSRSEYISAGGNASGGVMNGRHALRVPVNQLAKSAKATLCHMWTHQDDHVLRVECTYDSSLSGT